MGSLTIVSGSPGAGKTTVSRELATRSLHGVHLVSDEFYYFIAHLIAPSSPESKDQNDVVIRAVARAAAVYADGGYDVFVDGVFGPWYLDLMLEEVRPREVEYIVLRATLDDALDRVANRQEMSEIEDVVRKMHGQFVDLGPHERHVVETHGRPVADVLADIDVRRKDGAFRLEHPSEV